MTLKYTGGGFFAGVPARDLTDDEIKKLPISKQDLLKSGLYVEIKPKTKPAKKAGK